jgi:phosphohistidine phosphatase SixA
MAIRVTPLHKWLTTPLFSLVILIGAIDSAAAESDSVIDRNNYDLTDQERLNISWASKIQSGGFILHFRHAQREQWNDVTAFDAFELHSRLDASKSSFARATCLTDQGKEEAKLLGNLIRIAKVKLSAIISSPSCRALQTAKIAFKRVDKIENSLLHRSAIPKLQHKSFDIALRKLLLSYPIEKSKNVVLVGHVDTLEYSGNSVLDKDIESSITAESRDPTGFVILERVGDKVFARHVFKSMKEFSLASLYLPEFAYLD